MDIPCAVAQRARKAQLLQDPERAMYARLAKYSTSGKVDPSAEPDGYDGWTSIPDQFKGPSGQGWSFCLP